MELFERYNRLVFKIALHKAGERMDAEDITQDVFLHVYRSLPNLREPQAFVGWLIAIAHNRANRFCRARKSRRDAHKHARQELAKQDPRRSRIGSRSSPNRRGFRLASAERKESRGAGTMLAGRSSRRLRTSPATAPLTGPGASGVGVAGREHCIRSGEQRGEPRSELSSGGSLSRPGPSRLVPEPAVRTCPSRGRRSTDRRSRSTRSGPCRG